MKNLKMENSLENLALPQHKIIYSQEAILDGVKLLAEQISADYKGREIMLIGLLKSSVFFLADLIRRISVPLTIDFIATAKYLPHPSQGSGIVKIVKDLEENILNKNIILVRTIIDTGISVHYLMENLKLRKPAEIKICSLLLRRKNLMPGLPVDYHGFEAGEKFLIGYGMDYQESCRNLPYIAELTENIKKKEQA